MQENSQLILHLVSDSSGHAVKGAARSALHHFPQLKVQRYHWPVIKNLSMLEAVLEKISQKPGMILYTLADKNLRNLLEAHAAKLKLPCISVIGKIVTQIANYMQIEAQEIVDDWQQFEAGYLDKVVAIEFAVAHDDGQKIEEVAKADIILVGPSRTSKTPTSFYLAYNGFKTANVPFIRDFPVSPYLLAAQKPLIIGLVINPERLIQIRESRLGSFTLNNNLDDQSGYTDINSVIEEYRQARKLFNSHNWPIIDVTTSSIEETAARVSKIFYERG